MESFCLYVKRKHVSRESVAATQFHGRR
jgi:hypothetical protein